MDNIDIYVKNLSSEQRAICSALNSRISSSCPNYNPKIWYSHPVWFLEENPIIGYSATQKGVNLLFWSGQSFPTDGLVPEGSFRAAQIAYKQISDIDMAALDKWLAESALIQWDYKNLVKNKGKLVRLL